MSIVKTYFYLYRFLLSLSPGYAKFEVDGVKIDLWI